MSVSACRRVIALPTQADKMLAALASVTFALGGCSVPNVCSDAVSRKEAYGLVETLIREGTYGWYQVHPPETAGGKAQLKLYRSPLTDTPFDPSAVYHRVKRYDLSALDVYSVGLDDHRGRALFDLLKGCGWTLAGGLVDRVALSGRALELFGLHVREFRGGFFGSQSSDADIMYEFYLVSRDAATKQGHILKRWTIPNRAIHFFTPKGSYGFHVDEVAGYLSYDRATGVAEVRVTGLRREFREAVPVK